MEDFSSDSQDDEEDCETGSQPGHPFTDKTNFYCGQTFTDKKELKMLLDAAVTRQSFNYYMKKSCTKLMKAKYLSRGCGYLLQAKKYDTSDRFCIYKHIRIANAFSHVHSHAHHELCMRLLAEILQINQHCRKHRYLFYATAKAYSFDEFSKNFTRLKKNCPEAAHVLENMVGFEKWCRAHFPGNRYDVMTTNIIESLNSVLIDEQEYPVSYIFNLIGRKFGEKFRKRYAFVYGKKNKFVPYAERILRNSKSVSDSLYVTNPNRVLDKYMMFGNGVTAKVNILERSCSCRKFDLVKMSCEHAMAVLRAKYGDDIGYGNSI
ncbi:uncharacterized protein LOC124896139 [Capsicum annuum]|uniref:uncharacterized protein LOC124896139 n=1 Tax=Capsicum annuum TaxID=4072 RepID=UPI001FB133A1|nr:uncharacterized protein LOC124896139 [Capsicum annuum]